MSAALSLSGDGQLILSGTDNYTGGTTVSGGTLYVTKSSALPDGSSLTVGAGGVFIFDPSASRPHNRLRSARSGRGGSRTGDFGTAGGRRNMLACRTPLAAADGRIDYWSAAIDRRFYLSRNELQSAKEFPILGKGKS